MNHDFKTPKIPIEYSTLCPTCDSPLETKFEIERSVMHQREMLITVIAMLKCPNSCIGIAEFGLSNTISESLLYSMEKVLYEQMLLDSISMLLTRIRIDIAMSFEMKPAYYPYSEDEFNYHRGRIIIFPADAKEGQKFFHPRNAYLYYFTGKGWLLVSPATPSVEHARIVTLSEMREFLESRLRTILSNGIPTSNTALNLSTAKTILEDSLREVLAVGSRMPEIVLSINPSNANEIQLYVWEANSQPAIHAPMNVAIPLNPPSMNSSDMSDAISSVYSAMAQSARAIADSQNLVGMRNTEDVREELNRAMNIILRPEGIAGESIVPLLYDEANVPDDEDNGDRQ